ncbi:MAG: dihydropteroate synthase [Paludibacteraceae bacterium]|nr:dihydropteroate synthase [Paludibacteraceae bacterium]
MINSTQIPSFYEPCVMGILNVTPDSFACHCSTIDAVGVLNEMHKLVSAGATIIDVGACSTRPDGKVADADEEWRRLQIALEAIRSAYPDVVLSVDTFRASVAKEAIERYGVKIINDVSGMQDNEMLQVAARACVPYILTHPREACAEWNGQTNVVQEMLSFFAFRLDRLHRAGVSDVWIDPGLGFGKSLEQNYTIIRWLAELKVLRCPIAVGASRKSMVYDLLDLHPSEALNGTTAVHVLALMNGADILRVHDVKEAQQVIRIIQQYKKC